MCGITGVYLNKKVKNEKELKQATARMNEWQGQRGPDDEGVEIVNKNSTTVIFGHRRLSIIDLSKAGKQPMAFQTQNSLWITFNGEIYNFQELKKDLIKKGYKFKTKTDTEVILALYAEYGEESFSKLRGMFAFGLWDNKKQKLFLVKDRYGIKPLYYYTDKEKLIFASTVKAIEKSGLISLRENSKAIIGFFLFGSVPLPMTTAKNILAVPAGHYLIRDKDGNCQLVKYYEPLVAFLNKQEVNFKEAVVGTRRWLKESVDFHLISDAPLGIFLSGGLDSSALAALAALQRKKPITTLSIDFEEKEFSEKPHQDLALKKIKSDHREIKITADNFYNYFDEIFAAMDQPTIDGVNTFFIAQAAKKVGLKTVLSGLGGDEIFCGYPSFQKAAIFRKIQKLPRFLKFPLNLSSLLGDRYAKLNYFTNNDILSFYLGIRGLFSPSEVAKILNTNLSEVKNFLNEFMISQLPNPEIIALNPIDLLSYLESKFYLQNQLLKDTDFMSMHHSVEVRVPFLDHKLVEYVSGLAPQLKIGDGSINKPLLAEAVRDLLPPEILTRKKMGFTFPFAKWLKQAPDDIITNYQSPAIKDLISRFKNNRLHWSRFWALYVAEQIK